MSIADYPELIMEAARRSGSNDLPERAAMVVGMAEDYLSKNLRIAGQETAATLTTDANGEVALPSGFREMLSIRVNDWDLPRLPYGRVLDPDPQGWSSKRGWAVRGSTLVSTYASTDHQVVYWTNVPSLATDGTSYLLTAEPELYLQAVLFQAYSSAGDLERAAVTRSYLDSMIRDANAAAAMARVGGQSVNLGYVP